jgi:hypothetical protein
MIVTYVLPTAKGALAKELVNKHGMTQVQVAKLFGVTSAAVSQYMKGIRGQNGVIDKSAYKDDFYDLIERLADRISEGGEVVRALCDVCDFTKESGLLKALYVYENVPQDDIDKFICPRPVLVRSEE